MKLSLSLALTAWRRAVAAARAGDRLLLQGGVDFLLLESGDRLLLE